MGELLDRLGGRVPGELVRSGDWNALVEAVDGLVAGLEGLGGRVTQLQQELVAVRDGQADLANRLTALADRHLVVTMQTAAATHPIGRPAEIVVTVTGLDGTVPPDPRPFVDFVTVWGRLSAVGGPATLGAQGRSLSVQVGADGVARALLHAESTADASDETLGQVGDLLTTRLVPELNVTLAEAMLQANTPAEAKRSGAFRLATESYLEVTQPAFTDFADLHWTHSPPLVLQPPLVTSRWREHRTTVIASVRADADPRTPDAALGSSSIQVTFRDWLTPWIVLDLFDLEDAVVDDLVGGLRDVVVQDSLLGSFAGAKEVIATHLAGRGLLGRIRGLKEAELAVTRLEIVGQPPQELADLKRGLNQALVLQRAVEVGQSAALDDQRLAGIDAVAGLSGAAQSGVEDLRGSVAGLGQRLAELGDLAGALDGRVGALDSGLAGVRGQVSAVLSRSDLLDSRFTDLDQRVAGVQQLYPESVKETFLDVHSKLTLVDQLNQRVAQLEG